MTKTGCDTCLTKNCFIKLCSEEWLESLSDSKQTCIYKKGHKIVNIGDDVLGLFFIQKGKAKVFATGINNKEQVVRLTRSGDIIGHRGYGGDVYPISACALEDSIVCFFDNDIIYKAFINNPKLSFELMMYYSKELRKSESKMKNLAQMNVKEKVADALLYSKRIYDANDLGLINIKLDRQDLANLAGINTEQLSRTLSELKKEGAISLGKNQILIKKEEQLLQIITPFTEV